jgi:hypothetical protein
MNGLLPTVGLATGSCHIAVLDDPSDDRRGPPVELVRILHRSKVITRRRRCSCAKR